MKWIVIVLMLNSCGDTMSKSIESYITKEECEARTVKENALLEQYHLRKIYQNVLNYRCIEIQP